MFTLSTRKFDFFSTLCEKAQGFNAQMYFNKFGIGLCFSCEKR